MRVPHDSSVTAVSPFREAIREVESSPTREQLSKAAAQQRLAAPLTTMRTPCPDRPPNGRSAGSAHPWAGPPGRTSAARGPHGPRARHCAAARGRGRLPRFCAGASPSIWAATFGGRRSPARSWRFSGSGSSAAAPQGRAPQAVRPRPASARRVHRGARCKTARPCPVSGAAIGLQPWLPAGPPLTERSSWRRARHLLGWARPRCQRPALTMDGGDSAKAAWSRIRVRGPRWARGADTRSCLLTT